MADIDKTKPDFVWNPVDIIQSQAKFLVESGQFDNEDEAFEAAVRDLDLMQWEWDNMTDELTERLGSINPDGHWHVEVRNFGWRKQSGYKDFHAEDGKSFLREILPNTDCSFRIFIHNREIEIQNFHHDSPWGDEWYTVLPARMTQAA
jgi:hypothetical protein